MIVGFGSVHIEVLADLASHAGSHHIEHLLASEADFSEYGATVRMDIGGAGGNIAINCASLGAPVRLATVLNVSAHSHIIAEHMEDAGVDLQVQREADQAAAVQIIQINPDGRIASIVSCLTAERVALRQDQVERALEGASLVYCDCYLSTEVLVRIAAACETRALPFFMTGVSPERVMRAVEALQDGALCAGLFLDRPSAERVKQVVYGDLMGAHALETLHQSPGAAVSVLHIPDSALSSALGCRLIISEPGAGAVLVDDTGRRQVPARNSVASLRSGAGAQEALAASVLVAAWSGQKSVSESLGRAVVDAAKVAARTNSNLAAPKAVDRAIDAYHDRAHKDAMTGLYNRGALKLMGERLLARETARKQAFSVIILDIDHFKSINDGWGHACGDGVIIACAKLASAAMRESDVCGRWGGEEYVCLLPGADAQVAQRVAERIRVSVEAGVLEPRLVTVSLGVAQARAGQTLEQVIAQADLALYKAKQEGRNRVCIAPQGVAP